MGKRLRHPEAVPAYVGKPVKPSAQKWRISLHREDGGIDWRSARSYADAKERAQFALSNGPYSHAWIGML